MELPFATLDVFTTTKFEGNPLAIVRVPASMRGRLTQSMKLKIAREFNLSETVFFHDDTSKSGPEARDIDIFTTGREIPFAGHPTIGSAVFARHHLPGAEDVSALFTKAGRIELETLASSSSSSLPRGMRAKIPHDVHLHATTLREILASTTSQTAAATLSTKNNNNGNGDNDSASLHDATIRAAELDAPIFSIVNGMTFILIRLPSLAHLCRAPLGSAVGVVDDDGVADFLDDGWRDSLVGRYYYVEVDENENEIESEIESRGTVESNNGSGGEEKGDRKGEGEGEGKSEGKSVRYLRTRMMGQGIEDPATGSAASALSAYLTLTLTREKESTATTAAASSFQIIQGVEMGRRSVISVETTIAKGDDGEVKLVDVRLGGTAVVVMQGTLTVDEE